MENLTNQNLSLRGQPGCQDAKTPRLRFSGYRFFIFCQLLSLLLPRPNNVGLSDLCCNRKLELLKVLTMMLGGVILEQVFGQTDSVHVPCPGWGCTNNAFVTVTTCEQRILF